MTTTTELTPPEVLANTLQDLAEHKVRAAIGHAMNGRDWNRQTDDPERDARTFARTAASRPARNAARCLGAADAYRDAANRIRQMELHRQFTEAGL